ncbi:methyltransferase domain-containing protein [Sarocladium implicatum]|nr:methyltransferase domain-containing protein [Sarocladium implicatum]
MPETASKPDAAAIEPLPGAHWSSDKAAKSGDSGNRDTDSFVTSTASLASSVLEYRTVLGRTYHSERGNAEYWGSNDQKQNESMDLNHHTLTLAIGDKLHLAPLPNKISKAVDIGTGTGLWAIDFADEHPECEVVGTDLSPIQPSWVPPNCKFHIEDCCQDWTFEPNSVDFIHMRYLTGSIADWHHLFGEAFKTLRSGGWVESLEASPYMRSDDGSVKDDSAMGQWGKLFVSCSKQLGRSFTMVDDGTHKSSMEAAGFVDIGQFNMKVPIGAWPRDSKQKEMGKFSQATLEQDVEGYVSYVASMQGWTQEQVGVYAASLRREVRDTDIHGYFYLSLIWGRKP